MKKRKNIKDYLHFYIGQNILIRKTGKIAKFDFYYPTGKECIGTFSQVKADYTEKQAVLLLRPFSDMTKKEIIECSKYEGTAVFTKEAVLSVNGELHVWLVKKGFDVFGLIKAGLALDRKKVLFPKKIVTTYNGGKKVKTETK